MTNYFGKRYSIVHTSNAVMDASVQITGSSCGIGLGFVQHLVKRGDKVIAGVRNLDKAEYVKAITSEHLHIVQLDVTDYASIKAEAAKVNEIVPESLYILIKTAGIILTNNLDPEIESAEGFITSFKANCVSVLQVTQALLTALEKRNRRLMQPFRWRVALMS
ncbi:hypothetical protein BZG36_01675 [Bifiguratus adelaidae]|uniref:Ketoreductase (KR) domain-containing protein n=1 Tax=Bifiguratus adelaidae TaxID=1938954 RepID=A0A261Y4L5_9FUNG|nr:hypothetical protein BZG36_01675 [Bifiguratus adelaidae]